MTKKLAADGLVERAPYRGVTLTDGPAAALEVLRHHRLLELFLSDRLGMSLDEVHAEADRLEHVLSEELEARIDAALGYPTHDPHGHPIPDASLRVRASEWRPLSELRVGESRTIRRVPGWRRGGVGCIRQPRSDAGTSSSELLLAAPFNGPLTVRSSGGDHAISRGRLASAIGVG